MWTSDLFRQEISKQMMKVKFTWPCQTWGRSPEGQVLFEELKSAWAPCGTGGWKWGEGELLALNQSWSPALFDFALMLWVCLCSPFIQASISCRSISKWFWESHIMKTCQWRKMASVSSGADVWPVTSGGLMFLGSPLVEYYTHHIPSAHSGGVN